MGKYCLRLAKTSDRFTVRWLWRPSCLLDPMAPRRRSNMLNLLGIRREEKGTGKKRGRNSLLMRLIHLAGEGKVFVRDAVSMPIL